MAIKEMKEHLKVNESAGSSMGRSQDITPTPQHSIEKDLQMQIMQLKATNQQVERGGEEGVGRKGGGRRKHNKVFKITQSYTTYCFCCLFPLHVCLSKSHIPSLDQNANKY